MLIVEDGTGKSDANTYVSADAFVSYASLRGVTVTAESSSAALIKAADYLETCVTGDWIGEQTTATQSLSWPRSTRDIYTREVTDLGVPRKLVQAQCLLALTVINGTDIMPVRTASAAVTKEVVGPITMEYADTSTTYGLLPDIAGLDKLLEGLLTDNGFGPLHGVRV